MIHFILVTVIILLTESILGGQSVNEVSGKDLRLTYTSDIDQTEQPYRIYVPSIYNGREKLPLVVALHGSSGDESSLFDGAGYGKGAIKGVAEKYGVLLVSPRGRGLTEYRGIGENDVFCVLEDVRKRYRVDEDRIYLLGHSMGGTGSAYLALHHPDIFAAVAPLSAADSFSWLAANARHVPFWWIGGALDKEVFLNRVAIGVESMRRLGCPVKSEVMAGEGHWGPVKDFDAVFSWILQHRRVAHPREYVFEVDTPLHGRAYWTSVERIAQPGKLAVVQAHLEGDNRVFFDVDNVTQFTFSPDPQLVNWSQAIHISVNSHVLLSQKIAGNQELQLTNGLSQWNAKIRPRRGVRLTAYRDHPVSWARERLDMSGTEARLANWITDAMRDATGADLALYNRQYYRGSPIPSGTVDIVDLIQCSKPYDDFLVTAKLAGRELLEILDDNVPDPKKDVHTRWDGPEANRLVQLSGAHYSFDPKLPPGKRIVWSDIQPNRVYTVVMGGEVVSVQTILLAGRYKKLNYQLTNIPFSMALYRYASRSHSIEGAIEGRVRQVESSN